MTGPGTVVGGAAPILMLHSAKGLGLGIQIATQGTRSIRHASEGILVEFTSKPLPRVPCGF